MFAILIRVGIAAAAGYFAVRAEEEKHGLNHELKTNQDKCSKIFSKVQDLDPNDGDLIEIQASRGYSHWVIYIGNGYVIHMTGPFEPGKYKIIEDKLMQAVMGRKCRVNNLENAAQDRKLTARIGHDVVRCARRMLNTLVEYHVYDNNCEHFVTLCRFGQGFSLQGEAANKRPIYRTLGPIIDPIINGFGNIPGPSGINRTKQCHTMKDVGMFINFEHKSFGIERTRVVGLSDEQLDKFTCGICLEIFIDPMVTQCCGQTYCSHCINEWLSEHNSCPNDRQHLEKNKLKKAPRFVYNFLDDMEIKCEFNGKGCNEIIKIINLDSHQMRCKFNPSYMTQ